MPSHGVPFHIYDELHSTMEFEIKHNPYGATTPYDLSNFKSETPALSSPFWDCASAGPSSPNYTKSHQTLTPSIEKANVKALNMANCHEMNIIFALKEYKWSDQVITSVSSFIAPETRNSAQIVSLISPTYVLLSPNCGTMKFVGHTLLFRAGVANLTKASGIVYHEVAGFNVNDYNFLWGDSEVENSKYNTILNPVHGVKIPFTSCCEFVNGP